MHGRDDFHLLDLAPSLANIGGLLRSLEDQHQVQFRRKLALVRTNISDSEPIVRKWIESL